jgi:hypothetical protein
VIDTFQIEVTKKDEKKTLNGMNSIELEPKNQESDLVERKVQDREVKEIVEQGETIRVAEVIEYKKGEVLLKETVVESEDEDKSENQEQNQDDVVVKKLNFSALANRESEKRFPSLLKKPESKEKELMSDDESNNSVSEYSVSVKEEEFQKIVLKVRVSAPINIPTDIPIPIEQRLKNEHEKIFQEKELNLEDSRRKIEAQDELINAPNSKAPIEEAPLPDENDQPFKKEASFIKKFSEVPNNYSEQISAGVNLFNLKILIV